MKKIRLLFVNLMGKRTLDMMESLLNSLELPVEMEVIYPADFMKKKPFVFSEYELKLFADVKDRYFDVMFVSGSLMDRQKIETVPFYQELCELIDWSREHVGKCAFSCWSSCAALHYLYGLEEELKNPIIYAMYENQILHRYSPLFSGMENITAFPCFHSRMINIKLQDLAAAEGVSLLAYEDSEMLPAIAESEDKKNLFLFCHPEYHPEPPYKDLTTGKAQISNPDFGRKFFTNLLKSDCSLWR